MAVASGRPFSMPLKPAEAGPQPLAAVIYELALGLPRAQAWAHLRDLERSAHCRPGLTGCLVLPTGGEGVGTRRRLFLRSGSWCDEQVEAWQPGQGYLLRLAPSLLLPAAWLSCSLSDQAGGCRLQLSLLFRPRVGRLGLCLLGPLLALRVRRMALRLAALCRSGQIQSAPLRRRQACLLPGPVGGVLTQSQTPAWLLPGQDAEAVAERRKWLAERRKSCWRSGAQ